MTEWLIEMLAHVAADLAYEATGYSRGTSEWVNAPPKPGDLVVEMSMHGWPTGTRGVDHKTRFGRYLGQETITHEADDDCEAYTETADVIVLYDGTIFRWTNARFGRVPEIATLRTMIPWSGSIGRIATRTGFVEPRKWAQSIGGDAVEEHVHGRSLWRFVPRG